MPSFFKNLSFTAILVICMASCEQDALVTPPKYNPKPAIMCLMSPQFEYVEASIFLTQPYFGKQQDYPTPVSDALLILTDLTKNSHDTLKNVEPGIYRLLLGKVTLTPLNVYQLSVKLKSGETFFAKAQVPPKPEFEKFNVDLVKMGTPYKDLNSIGWGGDAFLNPYIVEFSYSLPESGFYVSPQFEGQAYDAMGNIMSLRMAFADEILPANPSKRVTFFTQSEFYSGFGIDGPFNMETFEGALYTMDKGYRDFYLMQQRQETDNPFAEPVLFSTNFSPGALGVFGCYDFVKGTAQYKK
jgi:hypothetical protein